MTTTTKRTARPRRTPEQRAAARVALGEARLTTIERLCALLPDCHPNDHPSVEDMIASIATGDRWSIAELEAAVRMAERSVRKSKEPVTAEEAEHLKNELIDTRSFY